MAQNATNEFETILAELIRRETTNQLAVYNPYPFQKAWHNAKGHDTADPARQKCLMCANRIGKTFCGTMEDAIHATGIYPDWWEGIRFTHAVNILVAGITADLVRDTLQAKLLGDPHNPDEWGMAAIPKDLIEGKPARKQGYVNAIDSIGVRHVSGAISRIKFQAYEQGAKKFMATGFHVVHLDDASRSTSGCPAAARTRNALKRHPADGFRHDLPGAGRNVDVRAIRNTYLVAEDLRD